MPTLSAADTSEDSADTAVSWRSSSSSENSGAAASGAVVVADISEGVGRLRAQSVGEVNHVVQLFDVGEAENNVVDEETVDNQDVSCISCRRHVHCFQPLEPSICNTNSPPSHKLTKDSDNKVRRIQQLQQQQQSQDQTRTSRRLQRPTMLGVSQPSLVSVIRVHQRANSSNTVAQSANSNSAMAGIVKPRFSKPTVQLRTCQRIMLMKQKVEDDESRWLKSPVQTVVTSLDTSSSTLPSVAFSSSDDSSSGTVKIAGTRYQQIYNSNAQSPSFRSALHAESFAPDVKQPDAITSSQSIDDDVTTSTTTSLSEVPDTLDLEQYDNQDAYLNEFNQLLPNSMTETGRRVSLTHASDNQKPAILHRTLSSSATAASASERRYRGGRRRESTPPMMTKEQQVEWNRQRQKKDNHNDIEKRRRLKINENIIILGTLLPPEYDLGLQNNRKGAILEASVKYMRRLQQCQDDIQLLVEREQALLHENESLSQENQKLMVSLQQMKAMIDSVRFQPYCRVPNARQYISATTNSCGEYVQQQQQQPKDSGLERQNVDAVPCPFDDNVTLSHFLDAVTDAVPDVSSADLSLQLLNVDGSGSSSSSDGETTDAAMELDPSIGDCLYADPMLTGAEMGASVDIEQFRLSLRSQQLQQQHLYHTLSEDFVNYFS